VYLLLFNPQEQEEEEPVVVVAADAAPAVAPMAPTDQPPAAAPNPVAQLDALAREVDAALLTDSTETLEPLAQKLSAHSSGATGSSTVNPAFLVARARVETALAQQLTDRAKLAKSTEARKLKEEARARARTAHQLADQALSLQADHPGALIAMADARRLEGERSIEVERWLRRARQNPAAAEQAHDADLVLALLRVRDDRLRDARLMLDKLAKAVPPRDVRPAFRVAWIEYLDANAESARKIAEEVIKLQPGHAGARALLDKLGPAAAEPVDTKDPMPPEEPAKPDEKVASGDSGKPAEGAKPSGSSKPSSGGAGGDSFDAVLARAEKLAENGNCGGAMPLYRKVLDMHPASVEALTGLGYCHLDRREFASAHARFRAALGISSRYQPAMWGIAEAYQQQGLKQQALERFEAFLSEHPSSPRAGGARTRIENLKREIGTAPTEGNSSSGSTSGSGSTPSEGGQSPDSSGDSPSSGSGESSGGSESSGSGTGGDGAGSGTGAEAPAGGL
ncbi:MAG TPA: tetratricopeptide repeat protein, partial [Kofleriaceae bacterium]|nr:tetratricopeptide repeat protein [Kofleriaceae bacterium]